MTQSNIQRYGFLAEPQKPTEKAKPTQESSDDPRERFRKRMAERRALRRQQRKDQANKRDGGAQS